MLYYNSSFFPSGRLAAHSFAWGQENSFYKTVTEQGHAWRKLINLESGKGMKNSSHCHRAAAAWEVKISVGEEN